MLDEPFVGLDPKAAFTLKEIMHDMCRQGTAIFFSTHVQDVAEKLCNKVAIIKQGRLIYCGTMEELTEGQSLEEAFLEADEDEKWKGSFTGASFIHQRQEYLPLFEESEKAKASDGKCHRGCGLVCPAHGVLHSALHRVWAVRPDRFGAYFLRADGEHDFLRVYFTKDQWVPDRF